MQYFQMHFLCITDFNILQFATIQENYFLLNSALPVARMIHAMQTSFNNTGK